MGKGSGVFCAMLFSCLLLTGCAENPTEDIVVNKNEGKLEQAIQRENKKDSDTSVPEKYTDQFQADGEKIEVSVDASVTGLEENKPVVRVKPHLITEEEAKRWADVLFEGATAYEPGEKSKTEIEDRILQLKERISDQDKLLEDYGSQEEADRIKKELEEGTLVEVPVGFSFPLREIGFVCRQKDADSALIAPFFDDGTAHPDEDSNRYPQPAPVPTQSDT